MQIVQHIYLCKEEHFIRLVLLMRPLKEAPINNLFLVNHYYYVFTEHNFVPENVCIYIVQCLPLKKIVFNALSL